MTTDGPGRADVGPSAPRRGAILVRSPTPPAVSTERCVDVSPVPLATFDGDRVHLALSVSAGDGRASVGWRDVDGLETAVARFLHGDDAATVRFGDRSVCRALGGRAGVRAVERRLAGAARAAGATLVTWTDDGPLELDDRTYDVVVDRPAVRPD